ncbi:MAG: rod shape-determining protein RodA [Armatimonadetes bacterium]|nr:rod shape-determining protein RodA [Armatimonadota bacterium]
MSSLTVDRRSTSARAKGGFDYPLLLSALLLLLFGLLSLYSQGYGKRDSQFNKQLMNAAIGLGPFLVMLAVRSRTWIRLAPAIYATNLLLLLAVLVKGVSKYGATRWLQLGPIQLQPSELGKLFTILTLASFLAMRHDRLKELSTYLLSLIHVMVPALLIFAQPHFGGMSTILVIWFGMCLVANFPSKFLWVTALAGVLALGTIVAVPKLREKVFKGYQIERMLGLISKNDVTTKKDANYQTWRAEIAFGVGGISGSGLLKGEQKAGDFVPFQYNDFIFTVIGEEGGLVGATFVLAVFGFFFYRVWLVILRTQDPFGRYAAAGVLSLLAFHTWVNLAMVMGLVPVVGLWLPFFSAGGTALWLCMACVGLLLSIRRQEETQMF